MKHASSKSLVLLIIGALLMSLTLILKHYIAVTDIIDGFLKGVGLGFMILSLVLRFKKTTNCSPTKASIR